MPYLSRAERHDKNNAIPKSFVCCFPDKFESGLFVVYLLFTSAELEIKVN